MNNNQIRLFVTSLPICLSIDALSIGLVSTIVLGLPINLIALTIIFLLSFSIYTFNRVADIEEDIINVPERIKFVNNKSFYILAIVAYLTMLGLAFAKSVEVFLLLLGVLILFGAYSYGAAGFRLKRVLILKNIIAGTVWGLAPFIVTFCSGGMITLATWAIFVFIFIRVVITTIFFDVKDVPGDKMTGVITIPVLIGIKRSFIFMSLLNIFTAVFVLWAVATQILSQVAYLFIWTVFYDYFYFYIYTKHISKTILYDVIAETEFTWLLVVIFTVSAIFGIY